MITPIEPTEINDIMHRIEFSSMLYVLQSDKRNDPAHDFFERVHESLNFGINTARTEQAYFEGQADFLDVRVWQNTKQLKFDIQNYANIKFQQKYKL